MRFTSKLVNELTQTVARFTGDRFKMHPAAPSAGEGTRYVDFHHSDYVWIGGEGARQACAYYIGGAFGWAQCTNTEIPEDVLRHLKSVYLQLEPGARHYWETRGRERAATCAKREKLFILSDTDGVHMTEGSRQ